MAHKAIYVKWEVTANTGSENIALDQLGCETMDDWEALNKEEQGCRLQAALDELPERVFIMVDSWHVY